MTTFYVDTGAAVKLYVDNLNAAATAEGLVGDNPNRHP